MMAKGRDVSEFYPDVVRNVIVKAVEVKKLVYTYLVHHADANATCRELALLAINSFQRDLSDSNQLIRGLALRVLCGIRVREIVQIQIMSVKKCASDSSPYVRKSAAHSLGKIFQIDPDTKGELVEMVDRLLGDKTTAVLSSAIAAFNEVCPENLPLLHPHYRKLCALLADFDEWGQIAALGTLTRYARTQFTNPEPEAKVRRVGRRGREGGRCCCFCRCYVCRCCACRCCGVHVGAGG
jgi:AP-3 complex subunit beta